MGQYTAWPEECIYFYLFFVLYRPTPASCVYHLLCKKLKKYLEKHPDVKVKKAAKAESAPLPRLPCVKKSPITSEVGKSKHLNAAADRTTLSHEKVVAERIYVEDEIQPGAPDCSNLLVNGVDRSETANSNLSALEVKAFVVSQSPVDLSGVEDNMNKSPRKTTVTPCVEQDKEESTALESSATQRTIIGSSCSMCSNASQESTREIANSASCELIKINRHKASQNLSHISVETRSTNGSRDPPKNTSTSISSERGDSMELLSSGTSSKVSTGRKDDEAPMAEDSLGSSRGRSHSCNVTNVPAMVLVEPVNAKVVSIPPSLRRRSGSFDQVPPSARMSLPHTKRRIEPTANQPHSNALRRQTSDCAMRPSSPSASEGKSPPVGTSRINRVSVASIAPYGLCCQVIRLSNSDVHSGGGVHDGQRPRDRRKTFLLGRRSSGDAARNDPNLDSPRETERAVTHRHPIAAQNQTELSNNFAKSRGNTVRAHDQECEQHGLPFKMRLPLTRKSVDDVREWRQCLRQESNKSGDRTSEERRRKSTGQCGGETRPRRNETGISPRRVNRNSVVDYQVSKGVSLPPAPGATPPDSSRKQIVNEVLNLARESPRRRLDRDLTAEPKDRRHVPDADYVSRLSQLRRSRQVDKERKPLVHRGDLDERDRRRSSEPNSRVHSSMSPPLLTSPRGAVIKFTHRSTRDRNQ